MKNRLNFYFTLFSWLVLTGAVCGQDHAFFTAFDGPVKVITQSGEENPPSFDLLLKSGDRVIAEKSGSALIMYYSGKEVAVYSEHSHTVGQSEQPSSGSLLSTIGKAIADESEGSLPGASDLTGGQLAAASGSIQSPGDADIVRLIYPVATTIIKKNPTFRWADNRGASQNYKLVISDVFSGQANTFPVNGQTEFEYPATSAALTADVSYSWQIQDENGKPLSTVSIFSLKDAAQIARIEDQLTQVILDCNGDMSSTAWHMRTAAVYRQADLFGEAENVLRRLLDLKPDYLPAHLLLAKIYDQTGRADDAKKALSKANQLYPLNGQK